MAAAGLITLVKTLPTIVAALKAGAADLRKDGGRRGRRRPHLTRPADDAWCWPARRVIVAADVGAAHLQAGAGRAHRASSHNLLAAVLVVVFGFLFVTVSSRIAA